MRRSTHLARAEVRRRLERGETVDLRVRGFSLIPVVPPGASVGITAADPRRLAEGDLVVVEIRGNLVCHVLESSGGSAAGPLVTRGLWAATADPLTPPGALVGVVASVRFLGLRVSAAGMPFKACLSLGRILAPLLRGVRAVAWHRIPPALKERLRRGPGGSLP